MDTIFFSPKGTSWNVRGPEDHSDRSNVVTVQIRKYVYKNGKYNILACADRRTPAKVFYQLENDTEYPAPPEDDYRVVIQNLLRCAPMTQRDHRDAKTDIFLKVTQERRLELTKKYENLCNEKAARAKETKMMKTLDTKAEGDMADTADYKRPLVIDDNDDDDSMGGILGVYCRSPIHRDYNDVATEVSQKVG